VLTLGISVGATSAATIQPPPPVIYQSVMGRIGMFVGEKLIHKFADKVVDKGTDKVIRMILDENMIDRGLRRGFGSSKEQ
jgi:xanthosine utilization system XapX-like protein